MRQTQLHRTTILLLLTAFIVTACLPVGGQPETPVAEPTLIPQPVDTVSPTGTAPAEATGTPVASATALPTTSVPGGGVEPTRQSPIIITNGATNVRLGPGLAYQVSHVLSGGTTAPILGRNADSSWWVIPGPGDAGGPVGWIAGSVVTVQGDTSNVPVLPLPAPPVPATATAVPGQDIPDDDIPVIVDPGSPPSNACVAVHPGGTAIVNVHLGPGTHFALIARLGNWAEVLKTENGWHQILIAPGQVGWVDGNTVGLVGPCQQAPGGPSLTTTQSTLLYRGPGFAYESLQQLPANHTAAIIGRNADSSWWAIPGGGVQAWLPAGVVTVQGDVGQVPVLEVAPPEALAHLIVDAATGYLLGGTQGDRWLGYHNAAPHAVNGLTYHLYKGSVRLGSVTGSPPAAPGGICGTPTITLSSSQNLDGVLALSGGWTANPRSPEALPLENATYREAVAAVLQAEGVAQPEVHLTGVFRIDLEGDGIDEVVISASRLANGTAAPPVAAGDYSLALLRQVINGQVVTTPLAMNVFPQAREAAYPFQYSIMAMLDMNGDGRLEIAVAGDRYEGRIVNVYTLVGATIQPVLGAGCTS